MFWWGFLSHWCWLFGVDQLTEQQSARFDLLMATWLNALKIQTGLLNCGRLSQMLIEARLVEHQWLKLYRTSAGCVDFARCGPFEKVLLRAWKRYSFSWRCGIECLIHLLIFNQRLRSEFLLQWLSPETSRGKVSQWFTTNRHVSPSLGSLTNTVLVLLSLV